MSGPLLRSGECRKFAPNIFNKTKCTNCFRQKEEHSAEALESNRATRKVAKCGYLFVAPGWDFTNPLNRTKRWQRRWFVLYDDGELSYALDEHPETVPQASIDMNKVLEVADAEDITGNAYSLAITAPDNVHFVKGTCREEARWWNDVLSVFPRSKGRPKRNATFPGSQTSNTTPSILQTPPVRDVSSSVSSDRYSGRRLPGAVWEGEDVFPTRDVPVTSPQSSPIETPHQPSMENRKVYMGSPPTRDKVPRPDDKGRTRRVQNREKRGLKTGRSYSEDLTKMLPTWRTDKKAAVPTSEHPEVSRRLLLEEFESECKLKDIADSLTRPRQHRRLTSPAVTPPPPSSHEPTRDGDTTTHKQVRGDPDGCGLDLSSLRYSPSSELRVDLPAEDLLNIKKGWLMKQGNDKEWNKHWFVLRGAALLYYRDPGAEDQGILDGVIDLSGVSAVTEVQVARNYGFQTTTWDERSYVLSAVTAGIRANWMCAIRRAAGLDTKMDTNPLQMERDRESIAPSTPLTGRSIIFSSDDEYRTASEGRRESGDWGDTLPPSPPLNRTPISKVKERARGGLRSRAYNTKRSRSSPPSSRRSTLDSVPQEDFVLACCGEMQESDVDEISKVVTESQSLLERVQNQGGELQEVKRQLTSVLRELSSAEEELLRLRQRKVDVSALEKQVEDLLQRAEDANKQRARDAAELDSLKKRYVEEKARWDRDLTSAECELQCANQRYSQLCVELADSAKLVQRLREELAATDDLTRRLRDELESVTNRLAAGIEENDQLYRRLRDLETRGHHSQPHPRSRSVDSLSDLTNIQLDLDLTQLDKDRVVEEYGDLRARFEKAVVEIRAMKRELRESQAQSDCLELSLINARQDMRARQADADSQTNLMAARIQDLALKLCSAEKQIRALKQKLSKSETREKRRSLSLKGRESFTICKELEDKLAELENKISSLTTVDGVNPTPPSKSPSPVKTFPPPSPSSETSKMAARLRRKSLDSATCSEPMKVLIRLSSLEAKVAKAAREIVICPSSPSPQPSNESITSLDDSEQKIPSPTELKLFNGVEETDEVDGTSAVHHHVSSEIKKMENLLRKKLLEISKKRESLIASGQWTSEARVSLLAEKLAFESVLVGRLHDAVSGSTKGDISDVERFMTELDLKLSGGKPNIETSLDYLAKALTRHLLNQNTQKIKPRKPKDKRRSTESAAIIELNKRKKHLDQNVGVFVDQVVDQLAAAFAVETLGDDSLSGGENRIKAAWTLAQEAVNEELIQAEISQVMSQCSRTYQNLVEDEKDSRFVALIQERASLELWSRATQEYLNKEMEVVVKRLYEKYQDNVYRLKAQNTSPVKTNQEDEEKARHLLQRFVDVIAHKALLDARLSLLQDLDVSESSINLQEVVFDEHVVLAEIQTLYLKYFEDLQNKSGDGALEDDKLKEGMQLLAREVSILREYLLESERKRRADGDKTQLIGVEPLTSDSLCEQCYQLRGQVQQLQQFVLKGQDCQRCEYLHQEIKRREMQFEDDLHELKMQQEEELARLKAELEQQRISLVCQHEAEQNMLKERARKLERRLGTLDSEYSQQMENLRAAYHKTLSSTLDRDLPGGENIRQRYQAEIEHLRALCEKGLVGMENSHRRMIAELEEKHRQEAEMLRREKESALAEETQATLAALDAMRKAHEAEVAREVAKFKKEFLANMRTGQDIGQLHREHEAEMEEIKQEILSLSEKYSIKCVESAALEEQLRAANEQLAQAQQHILQLDSRNKQLRAHLVSEANENSADLIRLEDKEKPVTTVTSPCQSSV
ncbi:protein outspread isoform X3 [Homalodisca vitripennis]|uniref:protein outspread isoform X3 n=1 Tax=Homalodisca vitripennis TaxID=197043 RepID=UPI001EEBD6EE|nr:protein outspread isoform X3 [Homalodisca vitripennis]